jgi:hypothetical protein
MKSKLAIVAFVVGLLFFCAYNWFVFFHMPY